MEKKNEQNLSDDELKRIHLENLAKRKQAYEQLKSIQGDNGEPYFSIDYLKSMFDKNKK